MVLPHRIHGTDEALCVKHGKRVDVGSSCPLCPKLPTAQVIGGQRIPRAPMDAAVVRGGGKSKGRNLCALGHPHGSKGEATACGPVHAAAAHAGLTTYIPGRPGVPCFRLPPDDSGRPAYASVDWVLCDASGKPVVGLDWKGATSHRAMFNHGDGFARTKRIFEAATGAKCVELKELSDIAAALAARKEE